MKPASMDKQPIDQKEVKSGGTVFSRLIWRQSADDASSNGDQIADEFQPRHLKTRVDASFEGIASTSWTDEGYVRDQGSLLSLQPWVFRKGSYQNDEGNTNLKCEFSGRDGFERNGFTNVAPTGLSPRSIRLGRSPCSIRSRRTGRPLISRGNCIIPQLYNEHFEVEEYVFNSHPSQAATTVRPLIITDGNRIISRSSYDPLVCPFENSSREEVNQVSSEVLETVAVKTSLPQLRKTKRKCTEVHDERSDRSTSQRSFKLSQSKGSPDRVLLVGLGISIGVLLSSLSSKREVEKLSNVLKDTENLVQDLQEELEMKESLTVKELTNEVNESQKLRRSYSDKQFHNPTSYFFAKAGDKYDQLHLPKVVEKSDSMSKIEAELEAELERLELNMTATNLEERVSAIAELDSDLIGDIVHGELRADNLDSEVQEFHRKSSSTSTTHTHNPNYAVSPRELSIRLHEVIQHRQEERIKELERALQLSQKQVQLMESFSNSDVGSSNQESTPLSEQNCDLARPLCLDLAGDALDAYNEAYEEFMQMTDTVETEEVYGHGSCNPSLIWEQISKIKGYDDGEESHEYEIDDEDGKMIQQIVERTRQGVFFSPDE